MPFQPIENYGVIGNQCTVALVGTDSSIDFFCFPEFDSPSIFASLLDPEKGGSFHIRPRLQGMERKQMYVPGTNILKTRFLSQDAVAELTDLMPITQATQKNQILRTVRIVRGTLDFEIFCRPAFDYARCSHTASLESNTVSFLPAEDQFPAMLLRATVPLEISGDAAVAKFTLREKEEASFVFGSLDECVNSSSGCVSASAAPVDPQQIEQDTSQTLEYWREWIGKSTYTGRWREAVNRSALILKLLVSRRHGSLIAAPTFGLPENPGGTRNWDYRFTWIRDAAFTIYAFMRLGLRSESDQFFQWLRKQVERGGTSQPLQIMYGLDGRTELGEQELSHLSGYRNSTPVRIGNGAYKQLQLDIYGELFDAIYLYSKYGHSVPYDGWLKLQEVLAWLGDNWNKPDEGIWEIRSGPQHFLHSRLMCWVAFDRAIRLAHKRSISAPLELWYGHRNAIVEDIYQNFWNDDIKAFTQQKHGTTLDAAVLLMPLFRFISPHDPRWLSTLAAVENSLAEDAFLYRYRTDDTKDGVGGAEASFTCCSFWFVECLARAGQINKAYEYFERILAHANHLGLLSEQIDRSGHQVGNYPQALSHLSLISAAFSLDQALSGKPPSAWSS